MSKCKSTTSSTAIPMRGTASCPGMQCDTIHYFTDATLQTEEYAKAFVIPQTYSNCSTPNMALRNGTYFADLHMPYVTINDECC